jgi:Phosphopantetheinyl transferase
MVETATTTRDSSTAAATARVAQEPRRILWPAPSGSLHLEEHQTHLWAWCLDLEGPELARLNDLLSPEEQLRARRFRFDLHRNRFIAGRGQLRLLLSHYTKQEPAKLQFSYGPHGKPKLVGMEPSLQFNLAHSAELALLAVNRTISLGVDLEELHPLDDAPALVARFFSSRENLAFQQLPENQKLTAFFNLWTRKEAWLKATGQGIGYSLDKVEVSFLPDEEARLHSVPENTSASEWQLTSLKPATGFTAALAVADLKNLNHQFHFQSSEEPSGNFQIE